MGCGEPTLRDGSGCLRQGEREGLTRGGDKNGVRFGVHLHPVANISLSSSEECVCVCVCIMMPTKRICAFYRPP